LAVNEWMQGLSKVRPKLANYQTTNMLADIMSNITTDYTVIQVPYTENDRWLALPFAKNHDVDGNKLSLVMKLHDGFEVSQKQSGLLIDEWVEVIPNREETTGVAFHFNQPNSEPPQTILLAVTPEETGNWKWQDLIDTLHETLELAKKRGVEPEQLGDTSYAQLLPAIISAVTRHQTTISADYAKNLDVPLYTS